MSEENQPLPPPMPEPPPAAAASEHTWALVIHLSALLHLLGGTFPGVNVVGPLVLWLWKRSESSYLDAVGKRVLNFQISWAIYFAVLYAVIGVLVFVFIGFLLMPIGALLALAWVVITIVGAIKESNGEPFAFPATIQFLK